MLSLDQIKWAAYECERQQSGEMSVYNMLSALNFASVCKDEKMINVLYVKTLGYLVEPVKNKHEYRQTPVVIDTTTVLPWENIPRALENLLEAQRDMTPEEFYQEFETIHPFIDGNGRVGAILYNWLEGTLANPVIPPEYVKKNI